MALQRWRMAGAIAVAAGGMVIACTQQVTPTPTPLPSPTLPASNEGQPFRQEAAPTPTPTSEPEELGARFNSPFFDYTWATDLSKHTVPLEEIDFLGLWRDAIPPIYEPEFEPAQAATERLIALEPVIVVEIGGKARAYPQSHLMFHEVVNDVLGGVPIAVTW